MPLGDVGAARCILLVGPTAEGIHSQSGGVVPLNPGVRKRGRVLRGFHRSGTDCRDRADARGRRITCLCSSPSCRRSLWPYGLIFVSLESLPRPGTRESQTLNISYVWRHWRAMSGTVQRAAETAISKRYEALLRVSQTLISIRSSEELFSILARELRAVVNFYVMGVGIYDEKTHEMRTTSYGEPGVPLQAPKFAPEETFSWWVYQHQQPLIIPSLDAETRFPAVAKMLRNRGVRSVCALPLTTVHRRLGGLAVGSLEADAYSKEEVSFLSLVANQVALAVDDALNFDASQHAKEALRASEESFRLIVDTFPRSHGMRYGWEDRISESAHSGLHRRTPGGLGGFWMG